MEWCIVSQTAYSVKNTGRFFSNRTSVLIELRPSVNNFQKSEVHCNETFKGIRRVRYDENCLKFDCRLVNM